MELVLIDHLLLVARGLLDFWHHASCTEISILKQLSKFWVPSNGQHDVSGGNPLLLVLLFSIFDPELLFSSLKDLSSDVL